MTKPNCGGSGPVDLFSPGGETAVCLPPSRPGMSYRMPTGPERPPQLRLVHALGMIGRRAIEKILTSPPHL